MKRSFGLVVALLNKPRIKSKDPRGRPYITSLVIVPHRDLAYQLLYWIKRMVAASQEKPPILSLAQVLVRDGGAHLTEGIRNARETPPHILIGTPQALLDVFKESPDTLQLDSLSSVVVDEVDYLIETIPQKDPRRSFAKATVKANRKLLAHPGPTRELLNNIYARRIQISEARRDESGIIQHERRTGAASSGPLTPQLIMSSATLRRHLNNYLFDESGWLNRDNLLKVKGGDATLTKKTTNIKEHQSLHDGLGGTGITHSVLVVSDTGIHNISGALPPVSESENEDCLPITPDTLFPASAVSEPAAIDATMMNSRFAFASIQNKR